MHAQKYLTIIEVVFSTTPKTSPHICNVLPLPNQPSTIATHVSTGIHTCIQEYDFLKECATIEHKYIKIYG